MILGVLSVFEPESHDLPHSPGQYYKGFKCLVPYQFDLKGSGAAISIMNSIDDQQIPSNISDEIIADFKTEYHPRSKQPTLFQTSDAFCMNRSSDPPCNPTPWHPFWCKGDFEFAKIALEASLNKEQIESLLNLISRVAKGKAQVTFWNKPELCKLCDWAAEALTPISTSKTSQLRIILIEFATYSSSRRLLLYCTRSKRSPVKFTSDWCGSGHLTFWRTPISHPTLFGTLNVCTNITVYNLIGSMMSRGQQTDGGIYKWVRVVSSLSVVCSFSCMCLNCSLFYLLSKMQLYLCSSSMLTSQSYRHLGRSKVTWSSHVAPISPFIYGIARTLGEVQLSDGYQS